MFVFRFVSHDNYSSHNKKEDKTTRNKKKEGFDVELTRSLDYCLYY